MRVPWTRPADVREAARKKLAAWLSGLAAGEAFVPCCFGIKGPSVSELGARFDEVRTWAGEWQRAERGPLRVEYQKVGGRSFGVNEVPRKAWIDGYKQAWTLLGVAPDAARLVGLADRTKATSPSLVPWLARRPLQALELASDWDRLLATVAWIDSHDVSGVYLRQVDVPGVDTKFIGRHRGVLSELLDLQLGSSRIDGAADGFEGRYGFQRKPGYVRFRCDACACSAGFTELTVRVDEFTAPPPGTARVYIVENEITYLAFPLPAGAIVVLGGGYAVGLLESLGWLAGLEVFYWGDIDTHGLAILDRLRRYFPHAQSMLMDRATLLAHRSQWVTEAVPAVAILDRLTAAEQELYRSLVDGDYGAAVRLEQERVGFGAIRQALVGVGLGLPVSTGTGALGG
jgi:hypothetical protein